MARQQHSPPIRNAVHLCVDMQNIFAAGGVWATPWVDRVLPGIVHLAEHRPARNVFTRFITPNRPEERPGRWRDYFEKWQCATRDRLAPSQLELVPPLARMVPPGTVIDKPGYSAFADSDLPSFLVARHVDTVIVSGAETDVCVLSTVLGAVEKGLRTIVVEDALCSSSDDGHDALMQIYRTRFSSQIELLRLSEIPDLWIDPP